MKNKSKKILAILLVFFVILSVCSCSVFKNDEGDGASTELSSLNRADVKYTDINIEDFDDTILYEKLEELSDAALLKGKEKKVLQLCRDVIKEYDKFNDAYTKSMVDYYCDTLNEEKYEKYSDYVNDSTFIGDDIFVVLAGVVNSDYGEAFLSMMGNDRLKALSEYEGIDEYTEPLYDREAQLQSEFDSYYSEAVEVTATLDGEIWSWDRYYEEAYNLSYDKNVEVYLALSAADNEKMGNIMLELVKVRNDIAKHYDYDNYYDMVWSDSYYRDYSYDDFIKICGYTKQYLTEAINTLASYESRDYDSCQDVDWKLDDFYTKLIDGGTLKANALAGVKYLNDYDLLYLADSDDYSAGFSTLLYTYREPYIYFCKYDTLYDILQLTHESGHAINYYLCPSDSLVGCFASLDVAEMQSNGFTLIYMDVVSEMYKGSEKPIKRQMLSYVLGTLQNCGVQAEIEHMLYTADDLTLDKANKLAADIAKEYGVTLYDENNYYSWSYIPHYSYSPGYVASYVTSAAASLALWEELENSPKEAMEKFDRLLAMDNTECSYMQVLTELDLTDVFKQELYIELKNTAESFY